MGKGGCLEKDTGLVLSPNTRFISKQILFVHLEHCSTCRVFSHIKPAYHRSSAKDASLYFHSTDSVCSLICFVNIFLQTLELAQTDISYTVLSVTENTSYLVYCKFPINI